MPIQILSDKLSTELIYTISWPLNKCKTRFTKIELCKQYAFVHPLIILYFYVCINVDHF